MVGGKSKRDQVEVRRAQERSPYELGFSLRGPWTWKRLWKEVWGVLWKRLWKEAWGVLALLTGMGVWIGSLVWGGDFLWLFVGLPAAVMGAGASVAHATLRKRQARIPEHPMPAENPAERLLQLEDQRDRLAPTGPIPFTSVLLLAGSVSMLAVGAWSLEAGVLAVGLITGVFGVLLGAAPVRKHRKRKALEAEIEEFLLASPARSDSSNDDDSDPRGGNA